ncbi:MAG: hypothetical protein GAK30_01116 [Paracidovorax wautersii]|uniref:Uncharacterized protein n=1 Tax=Paracidovorax wautersii TaxID=1177982 RepID=A0A7V8JR20_9BURK|nr:MAG: hypothetical protein GAK30_01116 [Paracidovorax wautersii]
MTTPSGSNSFAIQDTSVPALSTPRDLLVLRADHYCAASHQLLRQARRTGRVEIVVVADTRRRHFHYEGALHVTFSRETAQALGLPVRRDMQWRCGDYAYYLAASAYPGFRHLWLIETDLRLSFDNLDDFFRHFDGCDADLLTSGLRPADPQWSWTRHVTALRPVAYRCFFPLTRVSRDACTHLQVQRRAAPNALANDESFTATVLVNDGYDCRELDHVVPGLYAEPGFSFDFPVLDRAYERMPVTGQIYHPVLRDRPYLKRLRRYHGFRRNRRAAFHEACKAYGVAPQKVVRLVRSSAMALGAAILLAVVVAFEGPKTAEALMQVVAAALLLSAGVLALRRQPQI